MDQSILLYRLGCFQYFQGLTAGRKFTVWLVVSAFGNKNFIKQAKLSIHQNLSLNKIHRTFLLPSTCNNRPQINTSSLMWRFPSFTFTRMHRILAAAKYLLYYVVSRATQWHRKLPIISTMLTVLTYKWDKSCTLNTIVFVPVCIVVGPQTLKIFGAPRRILHYQRREDSQIILTN